MKVKFLMGPADCNDRNIPSYSKEFIDKLGEQIEENIEYADIEELKNEELPIYFIASGGAESEFKKIHKETNEPYILLTTPAYNSLAAAMEILGFLHENNLKGEILHGRIETIAKRVSVLNRVAKAKKRLKSMKLGCFGTPGGLIASTVDFELFKDKTGAELILFELDELIEEYNNGGYEKNEYTEQLKEKNFDVNEVEKALNVYGALKRLIKRYNLNGISVKCFDLLNAINTTGCLALAILNAEGIPAACEGDQKSLISMAILNALTDESGFMANPSYMDPDSNEIIFAHCTLPLDMPDEFALTSHFESGIGVAVTSDIKPQDMTVFKCDESMEKYYAAKAELRETMHKSNLCRTQMKLYIEDGLEYYIKNPISNHQIICKGNWKELLDEFFYQI